MAKETLTVTVARLYRDMTPDQISAHEDWVRRYHAEQALKADTKLMLLEDHEEEWISRLLTMTPTELQAADGDMLDFTGRGHVLAYLLNRVPTRREGLEAKPKVTPDQERASLRAMYARGTITPHDYVREMGATYLTGHASELPAVGSFHG